MISQTYMLDSGTGHTALLLVTQLCCWSHSSVACSVVYRIATLLLLATGFFVGGARVKCVGELENNCKKCINKTVKRFQMKSNGCRDVQHTGLQSTQTRRNTCILVSKGAQTRGLGTSSQASLHQWLHDNCRIY